MVFVFAPFWFTESSYLPLYVKPLLETESLQIQNGMSDGLLLYLAAFSSIEMLCACVRMCAYIHSITSPSEEMMSPLFFDISFIKCNGNVN